MAQCWYSYLFLWYSFVPFLAAHYCLIRKQSMSYFPAFQTFSNYSNCDLIPVYRRVLCDSLTPVSAFKLLDQPGASNCLFESVIGGEKVGRYSFIAISPKLRVTAWGNKVHVQRGDDLETLHVEDPLNFLNQQIGQRRVADVPDLPPFIGGAVGYAGYDVVRYVENLPNAPTDDRCLPDLDFAFYDNLVVFDNVTKTMVILTLVNPKEFPSVEQAYQAATKQIDQLVDELSKPIPASPLDDIQAGGSQDFQAKSNFTKEEFENAVRRCNEYILAGDIFQVVISQRFEIPFEGDAFEIYRSLRVINPSPFMFFVRTPWTTLVGASPEVMCRVVDSVVTVRPLAGTRPRGKTEEEDKQLAEELLADPKERAEHVMLVDLGRNDVGRVAQFGTVRLSEVMVVERYSHVMHISSNVDGKLRPEMDAMDALKACLPAGTVSGAPKVRAMQIIDEVEPTRRGPYAGAVGYIDYRGNMDTCIALRTMVVCNNKVYIQAGAGLVADSNPASEYQETVNKARAMMRAIEATRQRIG
jgi:anthranilate synthase component I